MPPGSDILNAKMPHEDERKVSVVCRSDEIGAVIAL